MTSDCLRRLRYPLKTLLLLFDPRGDFTPRPPLKSIVVFLYLNMKDQVLAILIILVIEKQIQLCLLLDYRQKVILKSVYNLFQ